MTHARATSFAVLTAAVLTATHKGRRGRTAVQVGLAGALLGCRGTGASRPTAPVVATASADPRAELYVVSPDARAIVVYRAATADGELHPVRTIAGPHTGLGVPMGTAVDAHGALYVTNAGSRTVTIYAPGAGGDARPLRTIGGPHTKLTAPRGVAVDASGTVYVGDSNANRVLVYAPDADGDAAPVRILRGSRTGLLFVRGVAIDRTGALYVANEVGGVTVYAPGASGNAAPVRQIGARMTGVDNLDVRQPLHLTFGSADTLYVATATNTVAVYAPGADGSVAPVRRIAGPHTGLRAPTPLAVDARGMLYVWNGYGPPAIAVYAPGASGDVAPVRTVVIPTTDLTASHEIGPGGRPLHRAPRDTASSVTVYAPGARGNVRPVRTIAGPHTGLGLAVAAAVDHAGELYVLSCDGGITVYAPDANGDARPVRAVVGRGWQQYAAAASLGLALGPGESVYVATTTYWGGGRSWINVYGVGLGLPPKRVSYAGGVSGALALDPGGAPYVAMLTSVRRYAAGVAPDRSPVDSISGPTTELSWVGGVAVDASGVVYTTNQDDAVRIYARGASGDVRPLRALAGPATQLDGPVAVTLDRVGALYVLNQSAPNGGSITVYAPGADGDAAPVRILAGPRTGLAVPRALALDASGAVYVVNAPADLSRCFGGMV